MILLKILGIIAIIVLVFFVLTFVVYIFNLDMKMAAKLISPMTKYYDWSKEKRNAKKAGEE